MQHVLGIDVGSTAVKVNLLTADGTLLDESSRPHDLLSPHPNWAEEDAAVWWENVCGAVSEIASRRPAEMKSLAAVGCSGMVPAIVLLDGNDRPVRRTIQQQDARCIDQIRRISETLDQKELFERTGGVTNQQHILPRLLWVKENEPEAWSRVKTVLGSYDWVNFKLTGVRSLEMNWAVESGSLDIRTRQWITADLERFGIDPAILPAPAPSMQVIGEVQPGASRETGIPAGVPVISGSADHIASTLSAGMVDSGDLLIKFGGAGDILYCVDEIRTSPKLFFDYSDIPGKYIINGCMASSGSLVKWFTKDILGSEDPGILKRLDREASKLPPASDGLVILPYFVGEKTPIFDPAARGVMFGLTLSHTRAHIFRAVLESVIYGFRHHIEVIREMGLEPRSVIATNGGSKSSFWCQIASDVLGAPVRSYPYHPGSALGVGFLAGKALGVYREWADVRQFLTEYRDYEPQPRAVDVYNRSYAIYRELYRALRPSFDAVQRLYPHG